MTAYSTAFALPQLLATLHPQHWPGDSDLVELFTLLQGFFTFSAFKRPQNSQQLPFAKWKMASISQQKCGLLWQCPRCLKYKSFTGCKFCAVDGHPCIVDEYGTSWDMTALDALPAPKHGQPPCAFTDGGEYLHCCSFLTVGSKKAYMEVKFRIFCASTNEFTFKLEDKEEQTLSLNCMLAEVYEVRGAGTFSDSTTLVFAGMGEEECPRLIQRLREMLTGSDDYKRKLFTSTINAGKLKKVFHAASRLKRAMMAVDISSYGDEQPADSNKVWYWRESVACEMLPTLETRTDEELESYWDSDSEEDGLARTGRDMGRMFFLPMPGDQEWEKGYVVEYLRPCLPVEVPTKEDSAGRKVDSSFLADYNVNNSANWRFHKQANVCLDNVLHGPRKRKQTSVPVAEAKSMLGSSNVVPVSSMNESVDKGQWHMVHFWGNDYAAIDSFPAKPPIFYPCFQSLKDYKLIFTNVREKKDAYTGKVQDWDFRRIYCNLQRLPYDVFENRTHHGLQFGRQRRQVLVYDLLRRRLRYTVHNRLIHDFGNLCFHDFSKQLLYFSLKSVVHILDILLEFFRFWDNMSHSSSLLA
eukprot:g49018.t1